ASPTTLMSGSASSRSRTPRRTTSWSSRRNTAIGSPASPPDPAPLTGLVTVTPDIREGPSGTFYYINSRQSVRLKLRTKVPSGQSGRPLSGGSCAPNVGSGGAGEPLTDEGD